MRPYRSLLVAVLLALTPAIAVATPIQITSGFVQATHADPSAVIALAGDPVTGQGFTFVGRFGWQYTALGLIGPTVSGQTLNNRASGSDFVHASATILGLSYPNADTSSDPPVFGSWAMMTLMNIASSFLVPTIADLGQNVVITTPFTFTGTFVHHDNPVGPIAMEPLMGSGMSTVILAPVCQGCVVNGSDLWDWVSVRYDFAEPVPEPGTVLLFASGLGALLVRVKRRCSRRAQPPSRDWILGALLLLALAPSAAGAIPIEITSGFIVAGNQVAASPMALGGDPVIGQGFTFVGSWSYIYGGLGLWGPAGLPGQTQSNNLGSLPDSVFGTATLNGQTYKNVGQGTGAPQPPYLVFRLHILSSFIYPALSDSAIVVTPFILTGANSESSVYANDGSGVAAQFDLVGSGLSTITLRRCSDCSNTGLEAWDWVSVRYDFMEPVPEPGTLLLLGSGATGMLGAMWRRRRGARLTA
jgi:hypothetical protein